MKLSFCTVFSAYYYILGGHPRNWNRICDACLKVVNEFIAALNATSQSKVSSTLPSATADDLRTRHPHLRLRSQQQSLSAPVVIPAPKAASKSYVPKPLALLWQKVNKNSLFAPFPDAASRAVFAKSQIVIWALEGMSHLVALSVFEDRYGVVQRRLGDILATFISLQQVRSCSFIVWNKLSLVQLYAFTRRWSVTRA